MMGMSGRGKGPSQNTAPFASSSSSKPSVDHHVMHQPGSPPTLQHEPANQAPGYWHPSGVPKAPGGYHRQGYGVTPSMWAITPVGTSHTVGTRHTRQAMGQGFWRFIPSYPMGIRWIRCADQHPPPSDSNHTMRATNPSPKANMVIR